MMHNEARTRDGRLELGLVLVLIGTVVLASRALGADIVDLIGDAGWPFFVIVPGLLLLAAALVPAPPRGIGFAIAGSIVTTVGTMLLVMDMTGRFEAWAYAWALIPGGAGVGSLLYGLFAREREMVATGIRLMAISAVMFAVGVWFFESVFATGRAPLDVGTWWPAVLIAVGALVIVAGLVNRRSGPEEGAAR